MPDEKTAVALHRAKVSWELPGWPPRVPLSALRTESKGAASPPGPGRYETTQRRGRAGASARLPSRAANSARGRLGCWRISARRQGWLVSIETSRLKKFAAAPTRRMMLRKVNK